MKQNFIVGLLICVGVLAISGVWINSNATSYYPKPGQWERLKPKGFNSKEYWQTLLPPAQSTEITFTKSAISSTTKNASTSSQQPDTEPIKCKTV